MPSNPSPLCLASNETPAAGGGGAYRCRTTVRLMVLSGAHPPVILAFHGEVPTVDCPLGPSPHPPGEALSPGHTQILLRLQQRHQAEDTEHRRWEPVDVRGVEVDPVGQDGAQVNHPEEGADEMQPEDTGAEGVGVGRCLKGVLWGGGCGTTPGWVAVWR